MDFRCSEYKQFSLPPSLILCSMISHPLCWLHSPSVYALGVLGMAGTMDQVLLLHHGIVLHWHKF